MEQNRNCGSNGFEMYNIGDRCEYVQYAIEIEHTLHNMQKELNTCIDPRKAAMVNHWGSILTLRPLDLGDEGCIYMDGDEINYGIDSSVTLGEFIERHTKEAKPPEHEEER